MAITIDPLTGRLVESASGGFAVNPLGQPPALQAATGQAPQSLLAPYTGIPQATRAATSSPLIEQVSRGQFGGGSRPTVPFRSAASTLGTRTAGGVSPLAGLGQSLRGATAPTATAVGRAGLGTRALGGLGAAAAGGAAAGGGASLASRLGGLGRSAVSPRALLKGGAVSLAAFPAAELATNVVGVDEGSGLDQFLEGAIKGGGIGAGVSGFNPLAIAGGALAGGIGGPLSNALGFDILGVGGSEAAGEEKLTNEDMRGTLSEAVGAFKFSPEEQDDVLRLFDLKMIGVEGDEERDAVFNEMRDFVIQTNLAKEQQEQVDSARMEQALAIQSMQERFMQPIVNNLLSQTSQSADLLRSRADATSDPAFAEFFRSQAERMEARASTEASAYARQVALQPALQQLDVIAQQQEELLAQQAAGGGTTDLLALVEQLNQ